MQSLKLGIPLVVGGIGQDKDLTNIIVDMNEVGINLGTPKPTVDQLHDGAARVLDDPKYKANALAMSRNFAKYDVGQVFDGVIQSEARKWQQEKNRRNK
jgi:UDP:flavonoid glycosyltransferase YjiC (YdhE family)